MPTYRIPNGTITLAEQREGRDDKGRLWRWEIQPGCGTPWPVRKDGVPYKHLPSDGSGFWSAVALWNHNERQALLRFAFWVIAEYRQHHCELYGGDIESKLIELGIVEEHTVTESCGYGCECEPGGVCYRDTPKVAALRREV